MSLEEELLLQTLTNQLSLGEDTLTKEMIVKGWVMVQQQWCATNKLKCDLKQWKTRTIKAIQNYTFAMWMKRNQILHWEEHFEIFEIKKAKY